MDSEVQSPTDDWVFPAINQNYGNSLRTLKHGRKQKGMKYTNHDWQTWPFDPAEVSFCFWRGPLRWLTAPKNVNHWLSEFAWYWKPQLSLNLKQCSISHSVIYKDTPIIEYKKTLAAKLVPGYIWRHQTIPQRKKHDGWYI